MPTPKAAALAAAIRAGEDTELELKEVVFRGGRAAFPGEQGRAAARLAEVFVSMANTAGGTVVIGARDRDRAVTGVDESLRGPLEQFVVNAATEGCRPMIVPALDWDYLPAPDGAPRLRLAVAVPAARFDVHHTSNGHHTSDGRYPQRIGSHRRLIPPERLARMSSARRLAAPFEERAVVGARLDDLDEKRLAAYFRARFPAWSPPDDWAPALEAHKLAVAADSGTVPTCLGLLLFADAPERFINGAFIDPASYKHGAPDGEAADSARIAGPAPEQIARALAYLRVSPLNPTSSRKDGWGRRDYPSYADRALQEAVVNAVVHRDYEAAGSQVIVRPFPDRIEFRNPGALYNTLTVENLYAGCQPIRRNQLLAGFLRDYKSEITGGSDMEARVEGFLNLVRESEKLSGRRPELEQIGDSTKLTIWAAGARDSRVEEAAAFRAAVEPGR